MNPLRVNRDKYGIKLKFPERTCISCRRYPCFKGIEKCASDFAKYGCSLYLEPYIDDSFSSTSSK